MARKQNEPDSCKARGFQKGRSGNPKGRPPVIREVQELAKSYTEEAVTALLDVMTDERSNGSVECRQLWPCWTGVGAGPSRAWT